MATHGSVSMDTVTTNKTYTLNCTGTGGSASQSATVTVARHAAALRPDGTVVHGHERSVDPEGEVVRDAGISPLWCSSTPGGTTDSAISGNTTAFQDVTYTWNFGDTGVSGTDTWAYGSNPGKNSRNSATGGVAAICTSPPGWTRAMWRL